MVLALLFTSASAGTAYAGIGPSEYCTDGTGASTPILNTIVSLSTEVNSSDLWLCYSTTEEGSGGAAVTGGAIRVTPDGSLLCWKDVSPVVVGLDCALRDDTPGSAGRTLDVIITVQGTPVRIEAGVEVGNFSSVTCLRNTTVYTPIGNSHFNTIGAC